MSKTEPTAPNELTIINYIGTDECSGCHKTDEVLNVTEELVYCQVCVNKAFAEYWGADLAAPADNKVGDGRYCRHHDDDPAHGKICYEPEVYPAPADLSEVIAIYKDALTRIWRAADLQMNQVSKGVGILQGVAHHALVQGNACADFYRYDPDAPKLTEAEAQLVIGAIPLQFYPAPADKCVECLHTGPLDADGTCLVDVSHLVDPLGPYHAQKECGCTCVFPAAPADPNVCWHCGVVLIPAPKPRCEDCPDECDVEGCTAMGCETP